MGESRLVKRTQRRQSGFGRGWLEVARLALLVRDGEVPDSFAREVAVDWQAAETPTKAATADELAKLIGAGVLSPDSGVVRKRLSLTRSEARLLEVEQRRSSGSGVLATLGALSGSAPGAAQPATETAAEMKAKFDALGAAIRSGVNLSLIHISEPTRPY